LLNRLDNDTWGFLYFAKTPEIYASYKELQQQNKLQKQYLAHVQGNPFYKTAEQSMVIDFPIMHHAQDDRKMVVIKSFADTQKWRWEQHNVTTAIKLIEYNPETNISTLLVTITKWIRHQIRCHLASIGCAIIGDKLYNKKSQDPILHLWSLGFKVSDSD
jgi:23S rRNA pseudouridine1911/1915/1917 synthase